VRNVAFLAFLGILRLSTFFPPVRLSLCFRVSETPKSRKTILNFSDTLFSKTPHEKFSIVLRLLGVWGRV